MEEGMNPFSSIYYVCCEMLLSEGDLVFDDLDFLPDFLDEEVRLYIAGGGNKEGFESNLWIDLYKYTDCMHDVVLEKFIECQKQFDNVNIDSVLSEEALLYNIYKSLLSVQENCVYRGKSENVISDGIRDRLKMLYNVSDQSRCGVSNSGNDAGEVDLKIDNNGITVTIIEAVVLRGLFRKNLSEHIYKLLYKYDVIGCKSLYLLIYYKGKNLRNFWESFLVFISRDYSYPYEYIGYEELDNLNHTESRALKVMLRREGRETNLYCIAATLR
ncbi:MAG: hypothetical protein IJ195_02365 [Lachnospiraceae bacterium]|nr:hypothetical protein [Lachnospiraceae bacterium]